jgi:hypothetical protein
MFTTWFCIRVLVILRTPSLSELCELVGLRFFSSVLLGSAIVSVAECQMFHSDKAAAGVAQKLSSAALLNGVYKYWADGIKSFVGSS